MAAPKPSSFYNKNIDQWKENRDCVFGQRAIHKGGRKYLPAPEGMSKNKSGAKGCDGDSDYEDFKKRTLFLNATSRTVEGMTGLIFRKKPTFVIPSSLNGDNADGQGNSITHIMAVAAKEVETVSRVGFLVEHPEVNGTISKADAEKLGIAPFLIMYKAEEIIIDRSTIINGKKVYTQVVLMVSHLEKDPNDEFAEVKKIKYFVLDLHNISEVEGEQNIVYRQRILDAEGNETSRSFPKMNNEFMTFIPFEVIEINQDGKSMIEDLVKANLNHYVMNASYTHGVYQTGFPTPTATGVTEDEVDEINGIGPNSFWTASSPSATFGMLEFEGKGLDEAKQYLQSIIEIMAALGADMLKGQKMAAETEGSKRLDKQASDSSLLSVVFALETSFAKILGWMALWARATEQQAKSIEVDINKDFNSAQLSPQMLKELTASMMQGAISYDTFWYNIQKGEIGKASVTSEVEQDKIEKSEI